MTQNQVADLTEASTSLDEVYSQQIVTKATDHDVRVARTLGEHVRHSHADTDQFSSVSPLDQRVEVER